MQTDPIADFLTRIRNANMVYKERVEAPASRIKEAMAEVLATEGYIRGYKVKVQKKKRFVEVYLKYSSNKRDRVINHLRRVSKPGQRIYVDKEGIPRVRSGLGICILSTPKGVLVGGEAKKLGVGGEVLCYVW